MAGALSFIRIAANGSRRGYNANKRSQAAQIAAQNGMRFLDVFVWDHVIYLSRTAQLQAYTPGSGSNTNDSRSSGAQPDPIVIVSDLHHAGAVRAGGENSVGSGGTDGTGPLHQESYSLRDVCRIGTKRKASHGACPARAAGPEIRVVSRGFAISSRMKSRTSSELAFSRIKEKSTRQA
jgi:hypothetical protein